MLYCAGDPGCIDHWYSLLVFKKQGKRVIGGAKGQGATSVSGGGGRRERETPGSSRDNIIAFAKKQQDQARSSIENQDHALAFRQRGRSTPVTRAIILHSTPGTFCLILAFMGGSVAVPTKKPRR